VLTGRAPSLLPLGLLATAAAFRPLRPVVLIAIVLVFAVLLARRARRGPDGASADRKAADGTDSTPAGGGWRHVPGFAASPALLAWAAAVPIAVSLTWGALPAPAIPPNAASCADPFASHALWRVGEAGLVLAVLAVVAALVGGGRDVLGLRRPSRAVGLVALLGAVVVGPASVLLGPALAVPFFGQIRMTTGDPAALVPALAFALANGTMEEFAYRGALMGWSTPTLGPRVALVGQAVVFGLAHLGPDFVGSPLPVLAAMVVAGLVAGWLVWRTGSLALPLALHIAVDIPLYYAFACRLGG
jgi:membrane protease YdiL (CAAX protease family)